AARYRNGALPAALGSGSTDDRRQQAIGSGRYGRPGRLTRLDRVAAALVVDVGRAAVRDRVVRSVDVDLIDLGHVDGVAVAVNVKVADPVGRDVVLRTVDIDVVGGLDRHGGAGAFDVDLVALSRDRDRRSGRHVNRATAI